MAKKYEALFTPLKVGGITLKNRIVLCAMGGTNPIGFGGKFDENTRDYYIARAKANVALMIPGVVNVHTASEGRSWLYEEEEMFLGPMKRLMDDIHAYGAKFFLQLGTGFGRSQMVFPGMDKMPREQLHNMLIAPSDGLPNVWAPELKHRAMTREEKEQMWAQHQIPEGPQA